MHSASTTKTPPTGFQSTVIYLSYWLSAFAEGTSRILLPLYFYSIGVEASKIAVMFFFYEAFGFATNMVSGVLLNRWGYKKAFILALFFHTIASLGYLALAEGQSLWMVMLLVNLLRAFRGMGKELLKTSSSAYVKQIQTSHLQSQLLLGGKDTAKGIGILVGGVCLTLLGFQGSFVMLGIITGFCLLGAGFMLKDFREHKQVSYTGFWDISPRLRQLAFVRAFLYAGRDLWLVIALPLYLSAMGVSKVNVGLMIAAGLVSFGLLQPFTGWFIKARFEYRGRTIKNPWLYEDVVPFSSFFLLMVPLLVLVFKNSVVMVALLVVVYNFLSALCTAPHNDLHLRFSNKERASVDIACYKTIAQLGKLCAVLFSGILYQWAGLEGCLMASAGCLTLSFAIGVPMTLQARQGKQAQKFIAKYVMKL